MNSFYSQQAGCTVRWHDLPGTGDPVVFIHGLGCAASYEYPRVVRFIEAMPMTTTGKIIRARLREMAEAEARADALHGAAENHAKGPAHER